MQPAVPFTEGDFDDSIKKKKKKRLSNIIDYVLLKFKIWYYVSMWTLPFRWARRVKLYHQ